MAVIENTTHSDKATHTLWSNAVPEGWESRPQTVTDSMLYRSGTGSRRKPVVPDETAYERRQLRRDAPRGTGSWRDGKQFQRFSGYLPGFVNSNFPGGLQLPAGHDTNVVDIAHVNALKKLDMRDLDLGTAWAERGKTAQLVGDVASKTVRTIAAARKRRGREILDIWGLSHRGARGKGVVDSYLAYHYGVKPLLQDISGATQALARMPPGQWRVSAESKYGYDRDQETKVNLATFVPYMNRSHMVQSCKVKISATQRPISRTQDVLWSLGLDNPLNTAWELTPFSFVVDWALPIGDWLSALNSLKYYKDWETVTSRFRKETCTFRGATGTVSGRIVCETQVSGGFYERLDVRRTVSTGVPIPHLPVKDPRSLDHMAKALALLASTMAGGAIPRNVRY